MTTSPHDKTKTLPSLLIQDPILPLLLDATYMDLPADLFTDPRRVAQLDKAFAQMEALEAGAIANPDEGRRVGHYWLRAPERAPEPALRQVIVETNQAILDFARAVHEGQLRGAGGPFQNFLVVGIGGSALGPQLAASALGRGGGDRLRPFFIDNTDPDGIARTLEGIARTPAGLGGTLVIITSKSGGTKETRNGQLEVKAAYNRAGLPFAPHFVAVTGDGSELHRTAQAEGWLRTFPMWDWVGGRTSELSAVGLLPAALQGIDITAMLAGARQMDEWTRRKDAQKNPAAVLALCWQHAVELGRRDMVILPYKDRLELFSRYLQQLVMESLGKEKDLDGNTVHQGIAVYGNKGSTDQHAYVQQLRDGTNNFFATFIEVLVDRTADTGGPAEPFFVEEGVTSGDYLLGFLLGTRRALHDSGRLSLTLTVPEVSAAVLGQLIALYERAVGFYASFCNINAYHQPGVEAGKVAAAAVLGLQHKLVRELTEAPQGAAELAAAAGGDEPTAYKILEHLAANGRLRRVVEPGENPARPSAVRYARLS